MHHYGLHILHSIYSDPYSLKNHRNAQPLLLSHTGLSFNFNYFSYLIMYDNNNIINNNNK